MKKEINEFLTKKFRKTRLAVQFTTVMESLFLEDL